MVYTFNIIEGIPWVTHDGSEVVEVLDDDGNVRVLTAHDFVYGMRRTLDPATAGDYAYVLAGWVNNGNAVNAGEMGLEDLGVQALDDYTLEVTAPQPAAFLPNILGLWMASAQPQWLIEAEGDFWTEAGIIQSYGPFVLQEWNHGENILIVRNPFWAGTDSIPVPTLDGVNFDMLEQSAQLANFEAGTLDISSFPSSEVDRVQNDSVLSVAYSAGPGSCTYYYGFNVEKEPFTSANIRRAFSMAIDRQDLIDNVLKGGQEPAYFFSRPNLVAAPTAEEYPDLVFGYDPMAAQEALAAGLADLGLSDASELPAITLMHNESESHRTIAEAVQDMWASTLGVEIEISSMEWAVYLDLVREDAPQIYRLGWCLDYPDTHNFLFDVFHSSSEFNGTNWTSETYDALVEEAQGLTDPAARQELYAEADYLLSNEGAAIAPIYYYTFQELTQPWVERTYSQIGSERFEKWDLGERG